MHSLVLLAQSGMEGAVEARRTALSVVRDLVLVEILPSKNKTNIPSIGNFPSNGRSSSRAEWGRSIVDPSPPASPLKLMEPYIGTQRWNHMAAERISPTPAILRSADLLSVVDGNYFGYIYWSAYSD